MLSRSTQVHPTTTTNIAQINPIHGLPTPSLAPILTCTYLKQLVETLASGSDCWQWHQLLCTESCSGSVAVVGRPAGERRPRAGQVELPSNLREAVVQTDTRPSLGGSCTRVWNVSCTPPPPSPPPPSSPPAYISPRTLTHSRTSS